MHQSRTPKYGNPGPQSQQVLKSVEASALPELKLLRENALEWYDAWQLFFSQHSMMFQELNLINYQIAEHGFSVFGSGLDKAHTMGVATWTILKPRLCNLMTNDTRHQMIIQKVDRTNITFQQFYHLLFTKLVPVFDRTIHIIAPTWIECASDINTFTLRLDTYLRVIALRRPTYVDDYSKCEQSGMFLNTIRDHVQ